MNVIDSICQAICCFALCAYFLMIAFMAIGTAMLLFGASCGGGK